jgi:dimethylargininase
MELVTPKLFEAPYVTHDAGVLAGAVVLHPTTAVDRLVPIQGEPSPIGERAIDQHAILVRTLRDRGVAVTVLEPTLGSPGEPCIGDCAVMLGSGAVVTRPSALERRPETAAVDAVLAQLGIPVLGRITAPGLLDAGDVIVAGETVYVGIPRDGAGLRSRSNAFGRAQLGAFVAACGLKLVEVALAPDVLRLRGVLSFVARDTAIVAPNRVDVGALGGVQLVEVPLGEEYAAGVLVLGERRVLTNLRFRESLRRLKAAKIAVEAIDLWEFGKAGAGPFSLVLATKRR